MMIKPSIEQLTKGEINRYALVIATAKCARIVTDEYVEQREKSGQTYRQQADRQAAHGSDKQRSAR